MNVITTIINGCMQMFGGEPYFSRPKFHVTLAWFPVSLASKFNFLEVFGDGKLSSLVLKNDVFNAEDCGNLIDLFERKILVNEVTCKVGNKEFEISLTSH